jgi:quercetin dioxygenase-like cupin family protein
VSTIAEVFGPEGQLISAITNSMNNETNSRVTLGDAIVSEPEKGLSRQVLAWTERMMLVRHLMQPGWKGTRHSHSQEQLVYIVRGHLQITCGESVFEVFSGDSFVVPGGVEHQAIAVEVSEVLDIFAPFREDYVHHQA